MRKSVYLSAAAAALPLASAALLQLPGREAAAQAGGAYINAGSTSTSTRPTPRSFSSSSRRTALPR